MGPTGYAAVGDGSSGDDGDGVMVVVVVVMMTKMEVEKLVVVMEWWLVGLSGYKNILVYIFRWEHALISIGHRSRSGIAGSEDRHVFSFSICCQTVQRRQWHPTPVLLPGKSHGWRSLVGCSPWGR